MGLVLESGEPREVHHFCLLIGYGASAVNPYLAFETIHDQVRQGLLAGDPEAAEKRYVKAVNKGIVKVISKMGISTVQSYHGAQVFEALGLSQDFVDEYFSGTPTRIGGIGIKAIAQEVRLRHDFAYPSRPVKHTTLGTGGRYQYRRDGEEHLNSPEAIHLLQSACRTGDAKAWKRFSELVNRHGKHPVRIRDLMDFRPLAEAGSPRGGRAAREHPGALQDGRDVVRLDQPGGARGARRRDEPDRREEQHGRGGRGPRPLPARRERRLEEQRDQAGGVGAVRRDEPVPRRGARDPDQDGAGRQAGRGGAAPRSEGLPLDREGAARDAGRRPHLPAAPPRHLLHRGPRPAHPRPEERERGRAHQREARLGERGRDDRRRGRQGPRRRHPHQRLRRRHGRGAADEHPARRHPVGDRPRRGPPDARPERPEEPRDARDRRPAEDGARRRHRGAPRRGGVRLRDDAAPRPRLRDDAGLPPEHVPGRGRDAGPRAAQAVHGGPGARRELHALRRDGGARADGAPRLPGVLQDGGAERAARDAPRRRPLEGADARLLADPLEADRAARGEADAAHPAGARPRGGARRHDAHPALPPRPRARDARHRDAADPEREPRRRDDARERGDAPLGRRGPPRRHDPPPLPGLGRARASARSFRTE